MPAPLPTDPTAVLGHARRLAALTPKKAAAGLLDLEPEVAGRVLRAMNPVDVEEVLRGTPPEVAARLEALVPAHVAAQWRANLDHPAGSVGRMMDPPVGVFPEGLTVGEVRAALRDLVRSEFVTYGYLVDEDQRLTGVLVMRELLFADDATPVRELMVPDPFALSPETSLADAMRQVVLHHFPVYPVCDDLGRVVGLVRGFRLFESQAFEISSQAGRMVGAIQPELTTTPLWQSFRSRHPWLQLNLLTGLLAAAVVSAFRDTIDEVLVLAAFLPVLAGQAGNTGGQALAVTVRAMTLGRLDDDAVPAALRKELRLGLGNGFFVGLTAGLGMWVFAAAQGDPKALGLGLAVLGAVTGASVLSGLLGVLIPVTLRRLRADPAMASTIFLTTLTDVASIALLLGLASWLVL